MGRLIESDDHNRVLQGRTAHCHVSCVPSCSCMAPYGFHWIIDQPHLCHPLVAYRFPPCPLQTTGSHSSGPPTSVEGSPVWGPFASTSRGQPYKRQQSQWTTCRFDRACTHCGGSGREEKFRMFNDMQGASRRRIPLEGVPGAV